MNEEEKTRLLKTITTLEREVLKFRCLDCKPTQPCFAAEPVCAFLLKLASALENARTMIIGGSEFHANPEPGESAKDYSIKMVALAISGAFNVFVEEYLLDKPGGLAVASVGSLLAIMNNRGVDWKTVNKNMEFFETEAFSDEDCPGPGGGRKRF